MNISQEKSCLRKEMSLKRNLLTDKDITQKSLGICNNFFANFEDPRINTFMAFMPFRNEVDTTLILQKLLDDKKRVVLPKVDKPTNSLKVYAVENLTKDLESGAWGIKEPRSGLKEVNPSNIDLILVPGLAFDKLGFRLGYGGGFYDRFFKLTTALKVGVCFDLQVVESVPVEAWDIPLDALLTDNGVIYKRR